MLRRVPASALALVAVVGAAAPVAAQAAGPPAARTPEQQLVEAYRPIVNVREQTDPPCDTSAEQYEPTTVDAVLGNPQVLLRRKPPEGRAETVRRAPTAADIVGRGPQYFLDLPGDTLNAGCRYARDFAALRRAGKAPPVTYAHVVAEPGHPGLVVQYWFYWYFNQFNDVHESDWEGMQVVFGADTPEQALREGPDEVALFQHGSGERAGWDDPRLETEGTHPVVYAAAGSHATYFSPAVYVGNGSGSAGVGCDNTAAPLLRVVPRPVIVPTDPPPGSRFAWLQYDGRWGQREAGFNNGPTGPNTKQQWRAPFAWMENKRSASPKLPGAVLLGPAISSVFCSAVATVSQVINLEAKSPGSAVMLLGIVLVLIGVPIALTTWRPVDISTLRRRRHFGQLMRAARQLYGRHWRKLVPLGLTAFPIMLVIAVAETALGALGSSGRVDQDAAGPGIHIDLGGLVGEIGRPLGVAVAGALVISFLRLLDEGRPELRGAYRLTRARFWRVVGAQLLANLMLLLLVLTIVGIPIAIWKYFSWQLVQQEILFRDAGVREAFRGSSRLVRGHWWHTVRVVLFLALLTAAAGPVLLMALVFTNLPLILINLLGSVVFALLIPYVATATTLLYFDLQLCREEAPEPQRGRFGRRRRADPAPAQG